MSEIENVSDQLLGFMQEVNLNILKIQESNPNLTYEQGLELAKLAIEDQRNDVFWVRAKQFIQSFEEHSEYIRYIYDSLQDIADNLNN